MNLLLIYSLSDEFVINILVKWWIINILVNEFVINILVKWWICY